jgi:hypothetical protein
MNETLGDYNKIIMRQYEQSAHFLMWAATKKPTDMGHAASRSLPVSSIMDPVPGLHPLLWGIKKNVLGHC